MNRSANLTRYTMLAALALALAACGSKDAPDTTAAAQPGGSTPEAAVMDSVKLLRANNFTGLISNSVPPAQLQEARTKWMEQIKQDTVSDEDRAQFAETISKLTGPNAEAELMAEIRPQLEQLQGEEMRTQLPMMIAMGKGFVIAAINESEDLTADQKPQVVNLINAVGTWAEKGEFTSTARAERAVSEVVSAARRLPVKTLDDVQALDFDGAMNLLGIAFEGFKGALKAYDIDMDQALDKTRAETLRHEGGQATVRVHTELFGAPLQFDTEMVEIDGRWYGKEAIENLSKDD